MHNADTQRTIAYDAVKIDVMFYLSLQELLQVHKCWLYSKETCGEGFP